jgi:predicted Zn-dependent protease
MKKTIIQGLISIFLFFASWFALTKIDWLTIFEVEKVTNKTEEKLGDIFWEVFKKSGKENKNPFVIKSIDSLVNKICASNNIERKSLQIHVLENDEINAFALPNGHLVIQSGLILNADNQAELCGVISHEIAHIQLNHVMQKLIKEIGLSVLISMTTGSGSPEIIKEAAKTLSSSAFDRDLEKEADLKAVDYLNESKINPEPFANFLFKLSKNEGASAKYLTWISTHPNSKNRAEYIIEYNKGKETEYENIISKASWNKLKESLKE